MTKSCPASTRFSRARKVILTAALIAATIVLQRFLSFRTPIIQINFMFVSVMLAGMMLGWKGAAFVATMSDLIGALVFPSGSFFLGYTLTAFLTGVTTGLCLYRPEGVKWDRKFGVRLVICILIITILLNGGLNTLWVLMMTGDASKVVVPVRIVKQLVMAPIMFVVMAALTKVFAPRLNQLAFAQDDAATIEASEAAATDLAKAEHD